MSKLNSHDQIKCGNWQVLLHRIQAQSVKGPAVSQLELTQHGQQAWHRFEQQSEEIQWRPVERQALTEIFALSDFIFEQCLRRPQIALWLLREDGLLAQTLDYPALLSNQLADVADEAQLHCALRQFRQAHMVQIAWRDLTNMQPIERSLAQVSELADALINAAYQCCYRWMCEKHGTPMGDQGPMPMLILGMGKLGGRELNFSSDIDLIFSYPQVGETEGRRGLEHQIWFQRLAQKLIASLHQMTLDGQVFRVDMRLRPFGDSGPIVSHFAALEDYYQQQGRDWERYAMLKARVINPDGVYSDQLQQILTPFVFRRYLDFSAIDALRKMKQLISQEVRRRDLSDNIKLGAGGIREIEFIVQSLQLIRAGRLPALQTRSLLNALSALAQHEILSDQDVSELRHAYLWLRKAEHCLQQFKDQQTQTLPDTQLDKQRLASVMEYEDYAAFYQAYQFHAGQVSEHFDLLIGDTQQEAQSVDQVYIDAWTLDYDEQEACQLFAELASHGEMQAVWPQWIAFKTYMQHHPGGRRGKETLDKLMPVILKLALSRHMGADIGRVCEVLKAISRRTTYLELLLENQPALEQLLRLCQASYWITRQITRFPVLLDELLNPQLLYQPTPLDAYSSELRAHMLRVERKDLELQMEAIRQFKLAEQLKIAAADVTGAMPVMRVSDHLTALAEALIDYVVGLAWENMTERYGIPEGCSEQDTRFGVIAYGKLGGFELGYGSDLDLVFVHQCDGDGVTNGAKQIESRQFYLRLAQRIMHMFATTTGSGQLYEVDLRLRPSGNAGLMVCHLEGFANYQQQEAWTWEHQALVRARCVYGQPEMHHRFSQIREQILTQPRDLKQLRGDVATMREKMRNHLSKGNDQQFDIKQDRGGIADIEFIVQYLVLGFAHQHGALAIWSDNVRILDVAHQAELLSQQDAQTLSEAYLFFRNLGHHLTLKDEQKITDRQLVAQWQPKVETIWQTLLVQ